MKWDNLTADEYMRLCECRSFRTDIVPIARAYMLEKKYDAEMAIETALEHLGANNQFFDLSKDEFDDYKYQLEYMGMWR